MLYFLQQLLNGLHIGAIYALLAFGYAVSNGVLHRTNLAHGALFAFAGQTMILTAVFGWQVLWLTLPATLALGVGAAFAYSLLAAEILSRSVFRKLAARSPNTIVGRSWQRQKSMLPSLRPDQTEAFDTQSGACDGQRFS